MKHSEPNAEHEGKHKAKNEWFSVFDSSFKKGALGATVAVLMIGLVRWVAMGYFFPEVSSRVAADLQDSLKSTGKIEERINEMEDRLQKINSQVENADSMNKSVQDKREAFDRASSEASDTLAKIQRSEAEVNDRFDKLIRSTQTLNVEPERVKRTLIAISEINETGNVLDLINQPMIQAGESHVYDFPEFIKFPKPFGEVPIMVPFVLSTTGQNTPSAGRETTRISSVSKEGFTMVSDFTGGAEFSWVAIGPRGSQLKPTTGPATQP